MQHLIHPTAGAWWSGWALSGWGLGIAVHGLVVWLSRTGSGSSAWQEQQIDEVLMLVDAAPSRWVVQQQEGNRNDGSDAR